MVRFIHKHFRRIWRSSLPGVCVFAILLVSAPSHTRAQEAPANIISYQGRLLDTNSVPVTDASVDMIFRVYDAATVGNCVWSNSASDCSTATARSVTLTAGLFSEDLGDTGDLYAAMLSSLFGDESELYLEVTVEGDVLSPRKRITG